MSPSLLLLLHLAWLRVLSLWMDAHGVELGRAMVTAVLGWLAIIGAATLAALVVVGYVIAAICLRPKRA